MTNRKPSPWASYEVRTGNDGKPGIYARDFNCRLATFNSNTYVLQQALKRLFDRAAAKPKRRPPRNTGPSSGDIGDQGYRPFKMPTRP